MDVISLQGLSASSHTGWDESRGQRKNNQKEIILIHFRGRLSRLGVVAEKEAPGKLIHAQGETRRGV